jgi:AcrR family transcriptional regulator
VLIGRFCEDERDILKKTGASQAIPGSKGGQTRQQIVEHALHVAAKEGLEALSIGRLAKELKMSKSGLFTHFGSKQELEHSVVERASLLFFDLVVLPIDDKGLVGIERVWGLCDSWLDFVEKERLPGGYFFIGAYFRCAGQSGPVPRQIKRVVHDWRDALWDAVNQARRRDELHRTVDAEQVAYELNSILIGAQCSHLMTHTDKTDAPLAILTKLGGLATDEIPAKAFESVKAWKAYLETRKH